MSRPRPQRVASPQRYGRGSVVLAEKTPDVEPIPARPGDSRVQRETEAIMVALLADRLGFPLAPRRIDLGDRRRVEIDAATDDLSVLCEASAHQGPPKPAQKNKVLTDAFKLAFVAKALGRLSRLILLPSDEPAAAPSRGRELARRCPRGVRRGGRGRRLARGRARAHPRRAGQAVPLTRPRPLQTCDYWSAPRARTVTRAGASAGKRSAARRGFDPAAPARRVYSSSFLMSSMALRRVFASAAITLA